MKRILFVLIILSLILTVNVAFAQNETVSLSEDIYVSVDGSDSLGDGSVDNPYQSLNYTIEKSNSISNIYLKSGTYDSTGYEIINKSISITGIGDVVIDAQNSENLFKIAENASLTLTNIKFVNGHGSLGGTLSPITNEGNLHINNCNFYNFTTINGAIFNKNSLTIDNASASKLSIDWKSVFGEAGSIGFDSWIREQIRDNPSRGEFITNIGNSIILNSKLQSTVYNNRNMNITNSNIITFISNRSYGMDINSIIDKSKIISLTVSNNNLLVINNSFINLAYGDELSYSNIIIRNTTYFNDSNIRNYNLKVRYSNASIISSSFNMNLHFSYSNADISYSTILKGLSTGRDSYVTANYNWWGDNKGPRLSENSYSTLISDHWIVMLIDLVNNTFTVDFTKYTNGKSIFNLDDVCDINPRLVNLEIEDGRFEQSEGYLINGSFKTQLIGNNISTMIYAKVDNQLLRMPIGKGFTDYSWYVSDSTGNDYFCDGSLSNPYKTLSKALSRSFNGNVIYIMEGVYTLSWNANLVINKNLTFVGLGNVGLSRPNARNIFIVDEKGILNIKNINFTTYNNLYADPLIYMNGGELHIKNSNFYDLPHIFGIISAYKSDSIYLDNVSFKNFIGSAIKGNSSYICVNNTIFSSEGIMYARGNIIDVSSDIDILNSKFEKIKDGIIQIGDTNLALIDAKVYICNTTFQDNDWHIYRSHFGLNIGAGIYGSRIYSVIDGCKFFNNRGHLVFANIINNSIFINNTDTPLKDNFPESYHLYHQCIIGASELINNSYFYGNELPSRTYEEYVIYSPNVYNSVFINNKAAYGGALSEPKEVHYCVFINNTGIYGADDIFVYKGVLNCTSNWWGSNQKPDSSRVQVFLGDLILDNWVLMNLTQDKDSIISSLNYLVNDNKTITYLDRPLPSRDVLFWVDNGLITPNSTKLVNNFAYASLIKKTSKDFEVYAQIDNQILSLMVYNNSTQLLMDDVTLYGMDNKYKITLINVNGHKISNQLIEVIVTNLNGEKQIYTLTTDNSGVAYLYVNYSIGVYGIEVNYYGNGYFDKSSAKSIINVSAIDTSLYSHNYTYWGKNNIFYTILTDASGRYLLNQSLVLNIFDSKNKLISKANIITGTNGRAEVLLSLGTGSYKIKIEYLGNEWYEKCSSESLITINPINTTLILPNVTFYGKGNDYEFTFTDIYGNKISDEIISLKISNSTDSKEFKIKVEKGVGSININLLPGTYNLEANYYGDEIYGPAYKKAILDIHPVILTFDLKSYSVIPENGVFTVILKDMYGKRVAGQNVSLELYDDGLYKFYHTLSDANGEANFKIDAPENIYFGIINFYGSTWYKQATRAATIEVSHNVGIGNVYLNSTDYVAYFGENNYYTIKFNDTNKFSLEGILIPVIISSNDFSKAYNVESDVFGNVRLQISLVPGDYNITYKYENDYYNIHYSKTNSITIYQMPTSLIASNIIMKQGDIKNFEVKLLNKNGNSISNLPISITIDNKSYNITTNKFGVAKLPLNLNLGYHHVSCLFNDENYITSSCNATVFVVDDSKTITNIESNDVYAQEGDLFNYSVILLDNLENPIKSSQIIINMTDNEGNFIDSYEMYTNDNGVANFNLNLTYGNYLVTAYYRGNDLFFESYSNNNIHVKPLENVIETILFGKDTKIINGYNNFYQVVLKTVNDDFVSNASIEFIVKGNSYYSITDEFGKAILNIPFSPGAYEVKAKYNGSNNLTKAQVTNYISVTGELIYLYSQNIVKSYNNGTHFYVALFDALGQPLSGKTIKFNINHDTFENVTDSDGLACFEVWFEPGQYDITAIYEGDYPDEYMSVSNNITVLTTLFSENITQYYDGSTMMVVAFSNFNGSALSNTNVLLNINDVTYKVKTDRYGFAVLDINLKSGIYYLTVLNTLTGQIGVYNINIQSTLITKNLVKYYKNSARFTATFKDKNGNLIRNTKVKFNLKGKIYNVKTNSKGVASLKINLKPGKYTIITLNTKTNEKHTNKITIKKTILTKNKNVKANKKINFQAKILKNNGKIAKKVVVKFNINKKTYKLKTNSKGIVKLNIKLKKGIYTIITSYNGLSVKNKVRCS